MNKVYQNPEQMLHPLDEKSDLTDDEPPWTPPALESKSKAEKRLDDLETVLEVCEERAELESELSGEKVEKPEKGTLLQRLDRRLQNRSLKHIEDDDCQEAVHNAFIVLEEAVRKKGDFGPDEYGTDLMTEAFKPEGGVLSFGETGSEKEGLMHLYRGGVQTFKNPGSHRFMDDLDRRQALNILFFVNELLTLLEKSDAEN